MTKTALTLLAGLALATSAQAGEDYSAKAPVAPVAAPCLWTWFAGGSVGYLDDMDTEMYTLHVGAEYKCTDSAASHAIFFEAGYANPSNSWNDDDAKFRADIDVIPLTLNYKYEAQLVGNLNWFIGAGAGAIIFDADSDHNDLDFSNTEFLAQAFGGLVYNFSDSFELFGGARYMYVTDDNLDNLDVYGDDWFYDLGFRFNF